MLQKCKYCGYLYKSRTNDDGGCGKKVCLRNHGNTVEPTLNIFKNKDNNYEPIVFTGKLRDVFKYQNRYGRSEIIIETNPEQVVDILTEEDEYKFEQEPELSLPYIVNPPAPDDSPIRISDLQSYILKNEEEFAEWFTVGYPLFGIRQLLKIDRFFPDVHAEMNDGSFLNIELEYYSNHFRTHKHNPAFCNLVISYLKPHNQTMVCGLPVISIFEVKGYRGGLDWDHASMRFSEFFRNRI